MAQKPEVEARVREIRRQTRRRFNAEEKIRIVLEGLKGEETSSPCAGARGSARTCTTTGARSFSRRASAGCWATPSARRAAARSGRCSARTSS